jgi:uncharacterized iron-regulated membrane protein
MNWKQITIKFHKWLALIIGIQVFLWILGGLVMSWIPIQEVRGEHNVRHQEAPALDPDAAYLSPSSILAKHDEGEVLTLTMRPFLDTIVYESRDDDDAYRLFDAYTGASLSPVSENQAVEVARRDFAVDASISSTVLLEERTNEYRGPLPVWQITFADEEETHLFVSPSRGRIVARRNATWRLFDFFWMLHIMDYDEREDFNHPLLILSSIAALIVAISGIVLIFYRFRRRDFKWILPKRK